jgi:hypothetical protein
MVWFTEICSSFRAFERDRDRRLPPSATERLGPLYVRVSRISCWPRSTTSLRFSSSCPQTSGSMRCISFCTNRNSRAYHAFKLHHTDACSGRAKFLLGSTLNPSDLERAAVRNAKAVFILSDRSVNLRCNTADHGRLDDDRGKADRHTILRAWAINDFAPRVKLYIQVDCGSHFIVDSDR